MPVDQLRRRDHQSATQLRARGRHRAHVPAERRPAVRLRGSFLAAPDVASETRSLIKLSVTASSRTPPTCRALEERIVIQCDAAVTVSKEEAALLASRGWLLPDSARSFPAEPSVSLGTRTFDERFGVAYVAGWLAGSGSPNADGLHWFVAKRTPACAVVDSDGCVCT